MIKTYLVRVLVDNKLTWGYVKGHGGWKPTYEKAKKKFGDNLKAFEPAPIRFPNKEIQVFKLF
jgi:hypothetical protein